MSISFWTSFFFRREKIAQKSRDHFSFERERVTLLKNQNSLFRRKEDDDVWTGKTVRKGRGLREGTFLFASSSSSSSSSSFARGFRRRRRESDVVPKHKFVLKDASFSRITNFRHHQNSLAFRASHRRHHLEQIPGRNDDTKSAFSEIKETLNNTVGSAAASAYQKITGSEYGKTLTDKEVAIQNAKKLQEHHRPPAPDWNAAKKDGNVKQTTMDKDGKFLTIIGARID